MPVHRYLKWIFSFHKYPRYLADLYVESVLQPVWRSRGARIGKGIVWHGIPILTLFKGSHMQIGDRCLICSRSAQTALGVHHPVILRTLQKDALLRIGDGVRMSGTSICAAQQVTIGDRCVIGADVAIVDTDFHSLDPDERSSPEDARLANSRPIEIGNDVFIGVHALILKGVSIGAGAVIGAGSIVARNVPAGVVVAGNPAKIVGTVEALDPPKLQSGLSFKQMRGQIR
jgi:acetyltransferase-like isoleucine patch superfamily enzyme